MLNEDVRDNACRLLDLLLLRRVATPARLEQSHDENILIVGAIFVELLRLAVSITLAVLSPAKAKLTLC